jgi:hypothetical protein
VVSESDPETGTTVLNAIAPKDVNGMVLVADPNQPLWRFTVTGSFDGPAHAALLRVGEIKGASSLRITGDTLTGPMLDATIVDDDERTARALAETVLPANATILASEPA